MTFYKKYLIPLIFITLIILLFFFSIKIRKPWFGYLSDGNHQWVTGHSLLIAKQWYLESPIKFKLGLPLNPNSIEFPTIKDRGFYYSFPSGFIWPVYLISQIKNRIPDTPMVMKVNLLNQLLVSITIFLISYILLHKNKFHEGKNLVLSFFVSLFVIFLPGPFYWFQNTYFSQEAIILPYCLIILFEILRNKKENKFLTGIESMIILYAFWIDWLSIFVATLLFVNNFIKILKNKNYTKKIKKIISQNLYIIIPGLIFITTFLLQTYMLGGLRILESHGLYRISNAAVDDGSNIAFSTQEFLNKYLGYIKSAYGNTGIFLLVCLIGTFFISLIKRSNQSLENKLLTNLILIPNIMEILVFKNHSYIHNFTALKLIIPISLSIPLCLSLLKELFKIDILSANINLPFSYKEKNVFLKVPIILLILLLLIWKIFISENKFSFFPKPNYFNHNIADFIQKNTSYNDLIFSPNYQIPLMPPQKLSLSLKRVYLIENINDIKKYIKKISADNLTINLLILSQYYSDKELNYLSSNSISYIETEIYCDTQDKNIILWNLDASKFNDLKNKNKSINSVNNWNNKVYLFKFKPDQINLLTKI